MTRCRLLAVVDAVVSVGGPGTVLSSLSAAKPLVVLPVLPDHHWNGERAAATGSAIVVGGPPVGAAVNTVLADPSYREAAATTASSVADMNPPAAALALLINGLPNRYS